MEYTSNTDAPILSLGDHLLQYGESINRSNVITELLVTERSYVNDLYILQTVFQVPLEFLGVIKQEHLDILFSNVDEIYALHCRLLQKMEENAYAGQGVADCFLSFTADFVCYNEYCANYSASLEVITVLSKHYIAKYYLEECKLRPDTKGLELRVHICIYLCLLSSHTPTPSLLSHPPMPGLSDQTNPTDL